MVIENNIPVIENPYLFDVVIQELQKSLVEKLDWLRYSFGKSQRIVKNIEGRRYAVPTVYAGFNDYLEVYPDDNLKSFSFFELEDPQKVYHHANKGSIYRADSSCSIIFWLDLRLIDLAENRNTEYVKYQISNALASSNLRNGSFLTEEIYEQFDKVFRNYSVKEEESQFVMHPYVAFRFKGNLTYLSNCYG